MVIESCRVRALALIAMLAAGACAAAQQRAAVAAADFAPVLAPAPGQTQVHVPGFWLDRSPVTNAQFLEFVRSHPAWRRDRAASLFVDSEYLSHWAAPDQLGEAVHPQQPVTRVSWYAARAYCAAAGGRLPGWYEWELAAAADEKTGDARSSQVWRARILDWYARPAGQPLAEVGLSAPNVYGLQDLHGLIWEWVEDFSSLMVSGDSRTQGDPDKLTYCGAGALSAQDRDNYPMLMRIAFLSALEARSTGRTLGFRCAAELPQRARQDPEPPELPGDSLFRLPITLQTAEGAAVSLASLRGKPLLVALFYSHCSSICPLLTAQLQSIDRRLEPRARNNITILMISLDADHDTPDALKSFKQEHHIDGPRWIVARAGATDVRVLAAALAVRYRELPDQSFNHTSVITLADQDGVVRARAIGPRGVDADFLQTVQSIAESATTSLQQAAPSDAHAY